MPEMRELHSGLRDSRVEGLAIVTYGTKGDASLKRSEESLGKLTGTAMGGEVTMEEPFGDSATVLYFAAKTSLRSALGNGLTLAPGMSVAPAKVDLANLTVKGSGAATYLASRGMPGLRTQGLPELPAAWATAIERATR